MSIIYEKKLEGPDLKGILCQLTRETVPYASHYCEENVYKLIEILYNNYGISDDDVFAVFITNEQKCVPIWMQRIGHEDMENPVFWDYHVIVLMKTLKGKCMVYDYDSLLPYPCGAKEYMERSFRLEEKISKEKRQWFRIVPGRAYLNFFSSDRSHMLGSGVLPPPWPVICGTSAASTMQLPLYWNTKISVGNNNDILEADIFGRVMNIKELQDFCA